MKTLRLLFPLLCLFVCFSNLTNCGIKPTVQASSVNPEDLEDEIAEKKKKIKELDKDLEDLKEDIDDLEDKEDDLEDEEEELDEREEELEERIRELERTPDATRQRELEEKRAELERVKARRDQINTDLTNIRNQINTKTAKIKQLSRRKLEAIVAEAEAENKLAQAHKERAENAYDNAKVLVDRANGLSNVPTEANSRDKPAANSALSDAEDDRDTTRTKASEAQTAYNDANTAKNGIDDDSTLAQIESAITTAETKRDLAETKAGEADTSADATVTHADEAIAKANIVIEAVRANTEHQRDIAREQRRTAEGERNTARNERNCWKKTKIRVCGRTIETNLVSAVSGKSDCEEINYCDLESITSLDLSGSYEEGDTCSSPHTLNIQENDFAGLTGLTSLDLSGNCLSHLESKTYADSADGFFKYLDSINTINLSDTNIGKLSKNFFNGVLDTLDDGGVTFTFIIYCSSPESPWKSKLGGTEGKTGAFAGTSAYVGDSFSNVNANDYCF